MKKKISMGLVLAMAVTLLTVTALAASQWGILDFAKQHGESVDPGRLVTEEEMTATRIPNTRGYSAPMTAAVEARQAPELVDVTVEEVLYEDGWLYAAMLVRPREESTLLIADQLHEIGLESGEVHLNYLGTLKDIASPGTMAPFAEQLGVDPALSVKAYAESKDFENVVRVAVSNYLKHAEYELLEDGSLRMLVQMEYLLQLPEESPRELREVWIGLQAARYDENGCIPEAYSTYDHIDIAVRGPILVDSRTRFSVPQDAHQIEGYRGYIQSVSVTPASEGQVCITLQLDQQKRHYGVTQMSGPVMEILDANGSILQSFELYRDINSMDFFFEEGHVLHKFLMPSAGLEEDRITIRLCSWRNRTIVYDEYTYTLK